MSIQKVPNWLSKRAATTPERIAVIDGDTRWTFEELDQKAQETARRLTSAGAGRGDFVAVLLASTADAVRIIHALQYLGAVIVLLNSRLTPFELEWQINDSGAKLLVFDNEFKDLVENLLKNDRKTISYDELFRLPEPDIPLSSEIDLDSLHTIIYTSGTTGRPKGVMLTNGNHWASAVGSVLNLGLEPGDKWLVCVPLFHMSGLSILIRSVIYGIPMIIHDKFLPERVNISICHEGVTIISVVSSMLSRMLDTLEERRYPETLRCVLTGGGPVPEPLLRECRRKNVPVYQTYGLTETSSQFATLSPDYMDSKLGSAGKSLFMSELKIMENGRELKPGEHGEIVLKGPNVARGYLNHDAHRLQDSDGWFRTGDFGYVDSDGFLYVLDRRSDLIISGGENIYPAEIEAVLSSHPSVREAGVVGERDKIWGQSPVAFVALADSEPPIDEDELTQFCREKLAGYKCPRRFIFVDKLPRGASSKLLRRELSKLIEQRAPEG
jgi:O-succinylbenzoic acid--CoA ligase